MSHLDNGFRSLTLQRFPATDDVNPLQAWEAADEYLLQQLDDTEIRGPVLILNDAFGALSCALAEHMPVFPQERMPCCIHCPRKSVITVK